MLRLLPLLLLLTACSNYNVVSKGGEGPYIYDQKREYVLEELKALAPEVIVTRAREPQVASLDKLFGENQRPLRRFGIVIFETQIQPTRGGLADYDLVYLSAQGKQLLTERLATLWDQSLATLAPEKTYARLGTVKKSKALHSFGLEVEDYVQSKRHALAPDDIFYLERGQKTPTTTVLNPRGMQDLSFVLVPATELMGGPKWSEHNKQFVNEVMKELQLDAVLIIMSDIAWTTARIDKHSGEPIPEEIKINLTASTLVSLSEYRTRAEKLGYKDVPSVTLCYRTYEGKLRLPTKIDVPKEERSFESIERTVLNPMLKSYKDLTLMMIDRVLADLKQTDLNGAL